MADAPRLAAVPVWAVYGADDPVISVSQSRDMVQAIRGAGGTPRYTEVAKMGHNRWTAACGDPHGPVPWMVQQVRENWPP